MFRGCVFLVFFFYEDGCGGFELVFGDVGNVFKVVFEFGDVGYLLLCCFFFVVCGDVFLRMEGLSEVC